MTLCFYMQWKQIKNLCFYQINIVSKCDILLEVLEKSGTDSITSSTSWTTSCYNGHIQNVL